MCILSDEFILLITFYGFFSPFVELSLELRRFGVYESRTRADFLDYDFFWKPANPLKNVSSEINEIFLSSGL